LTRIGGDLALNTALDDTGNRSAIVVIPLGPDILSRLKRAGKVRYVREAKRWEKAS